MRTKDELFRAAQREVAAYRQQAVMQAETARRAAYAVCSGEHYQRGGDQRGQHCPKRGGEPMLFVYGRGHQHARHRGGFREHVQR